MLIGTAQHVIQPSSTAALRWELELDGDGSLSLMPYQSG